MTTSVSCVALASRITTLLILTKASYASQAARPPSDDCPGNLPDRIYAGLHCFAKIGGLLIFSPTLHLTSSFHGSSHKGMERQRGVSYPIACPRVGMAIPVGDCEAMGEQVCDADPIITLWYVLRPRFSLITLLSFYPQRRLSPPGQKAPTQWRSKRPN